MCPCTYLSMDTVSLFESMVLWSCTIVHGSNIPAQVHSGSACQNKSRAIAFPTQSKGVPSPCLSMGVAFLFCPWVLCPMFGQWVFHPHISVNGHCVNVKFVYGTPSQRSQFNSIHASWLCLCPPPHMSDSRLCCACASTPPPLPRMSPSDAPHPTRLFNNL